MITFRFFRPRIVESLRHYAPEDFRRDLAAGVTVGIVAIPLAMAFAIASGVPPEAGLFTAIIAGFLISSLGGTKVAIGGPTGAFIVVLAGIAAEYGLGNLAICTILAGGLLIVMGLTGLGTAIKFIPYPVTMGFTSGIAVLIFSTQVKDFFGLAVEQVPSEFIQKLRVLAENIGDFQWPSLLLAAASFLLIRYWPARLSLRLPGAIVALVLGTLAVTLFDIPVETIGSRFGGIPSALPKPAIPDFDWHHIRELFPPAVTIAMLAAIESLLCAVVADGLTGDRHDSNQELIAQGIANVVVPLFGGIAATSAIARTATNIRTGGRTPVAGVVHALTILAVLLAAAPLARFVPLPTLSAVLVNVALHMGEWHNFRRLPRWPRSDAAVFLSAFVLTVVVDLTVAVEVGVVLAAILFIRRMSDITAVTPVSAQDETEGALHSLEGQTVPAGVLVYEISGSFFFGAADKLESALTEQKSEPKVLILRMRRVIAMDATGLNALEDLFEKLSKHHKRLVLSVPNSQPLDVITKAGFVDRVGATNVVPDVTAALERAREILADLKRKRPAAPGRAG